MGAAEQAGSDRGRLRNEPLSAREPLRARLDWLVGLAVGLAAAAGLFVFLLGPHAFDPATYFDAAIRLPGGPLNLFTLRIGLIIPVGVAVLAFGPSEAALYAIPLASGVLLAVAVYATIVVLFRDRVLAAAAALVTVFNAAYLLSASSIFPDTTATATFSAGMLCLVLGGAEQNGRSSPRRQTIAAAGAGVLFGWTYLIREFSPLLLLPAVAVAVVILRYPTRRTLLLAGSAVGTAAVELVYGALRAGNPFVHASRLVDHTGGSGSEGRVEHIQSQLDNVFDTLAVFPRLLLSWWSGWLFLVLIVIFAVALALIRDRRLWLFAAWFLSYWLVMALVGLASLPSGRWILNITNVRYWYPIFPALVMGAFGGLALLSERFAPRFRRVPFVPVVATAVALVVLVPGVAEFRSCEAKTVWKNDLRSRWTDLRDWFASPEADRYGRLWTDWRTHRVVPAYTSTTFGSELWHGTVSYFGDLDGDPVPAADREDALILLHREYFWRDVAGAKGALLELRRDWAPIFATADRSIVVLAYHADPSAEAGSWWTRPASAAARGEPGSCGLSPYEAR